jgi:hypothetical protein
MSLQDELDALRAEFVRSAPPGRAALYDAKVEELRRTFPIEKTLKTGRSRAGFHAAKPLRPASLPRRTAPRRSGSGDVLPPAAGVPTAARCRRRR